MKKQDQIISTNKGRNLIVGEKFRELTSTPEMTVVHSGEFLMGSVSNDHDFEEDFYDETPQRNIRISKPFAVGMYPVTFEEWDIYAIPGWIRGHKPDDEGWGRGRLPVININWRDAKKYTKWLSKKTGESYRLLSEAEWEYVARAGTATRFNTGNKITMEQAYFSDKWDAGSKGITRNKTIKVGSYKPNSFGLFDTHGLVTEWVEDGLNIHGGYKGLSDDSGAVKFAHFLPGYRVTRSGSYRRPSQHIASASRGRAHSADRLATLGFRVAMDLKVST